MTRYVLWFRPWYGDQWQSVELTACGDNEYEAMKFASHYLALGYKVSLKRVVETTTDVAL